MPSYKEDPTLAVQGEVFIFWFDTDNLASNIYYGGQFGVLLPDTLSESFGDLNSLVVPSTSEANRFHIARILRGAPELGEMSIIEHPKRTTRSALERMKAILCAKSFFIPLNGCTRPDEIDSFESVLLVYRALQQGIDYGTLRSREDNEPLEMSSDFSYLRVDRAFPLIAALQGETPVTSKILDVVAIDTVSCGDCAAFASGQDSWYALTDQSGGSPGYPSLVIGTKDGGSNYNTSVITSLGTTQANAMAQVGSFLMVVSQTDLAHHYCRISNLFAGGSPWTKVSSGYVASKGPRCIAVASPFEVYIGGAGGYIYKSADFQTAVTVSHDGSLTAQPINAIQATGQTILAVGDSNAVLFSSNGGSTWTFVTGPTVGVALKSCWIVSQTAWWVGTANGKLYYTIDSGANWTQLTLPDQSSITAINDIVFDDDNPLSGALVATKGSAAVLYRTLTGGRRWGYQSPYITNVSGVATLNAAAVLGVDKIIAGGEKTAGGDGALIVAA
jgi:photosystem II stability/assembly factor-like uncharacterized protein